MDKQIKAPKGIKIIVVMMFFIQLYMTLPGYFPFGMEIFEIPPLDPEKISISGAHLEDAKLHPEAVKMKVIEEGKIEYVADMAEIIILAPLVIIAVIGLWKMREWGLFTALIAFGARILWMAIFLPLYCILTPVDTVFDPWYIPLTIFTVISIVYLWRNRRCFS